LFAIGSVENAREVFWRGGFGEDGSGWEKVGVFLTFTTGIGLDEFVLGTGLCKLWGQPSQLGKDFVN
jgi:hypothetical protein